MPSEMCNFCGVVYEDLWIEVMLTLCTSQKISLWPWKTPEINVLKNKKAGTQLHVP